MLSGIGPADELKKHGLPVAHELSWVGKNMQDHGFSTITIIQNAGTHDRFIFENDADAVSAAQTQYAKDKTGQMSSLYGSVPQVCSSSPSLVSFISRHLKVVSSSRAL